MKTNGASFSIKFSVKFSLLVVLVILSCLLVSGCSRHILGDVSPKELTYFTKSYKTKLTHNISKIQFYLSEEIVLYREEEIPGENYADEDDTLSIEKTKKTFRIIMPQYTAGVYKEEREGILYMQFEESSMGKKRLLAFKEAKMPGDSRVVYELASKQIYYDTSEFNVKLPVVDEIYDAQANIYTEKEIRPKLLLKKIKRLQFIEDEERTVTGVSVRW